MLFLFVKTMERYEMEAKTIKDIEAEERDPFFEGSLIPDILQKKDVGARLNDYWIDTVMPELTGEWFQIEIPRTSTNFQKFLNYFQHLFPSPNQNYFFFWQKLFNNLRTL